MTNTIKDNLFKFIVEIDPTVTTKIQDLSLSLGLEKDLHYDGDYAAEFIYYYGQKFNVDIGSFNYSLYFTPENPIKYIIYRIIPKLSPKTKELTIGDLLKGIEAGRLDDKY